MSGGHGNTQYVDYSLVEKLVSPLVATKPIQLQQFFDYFHLSQKILGDSPYFQFTPRVPKMMFSYSGFKIEDDFTARVSLAPNFEKANTAAPNSHERGDWYVAGGKVQAPQDVLNLDERFEDCYVDLSHEDNKYGTEFDFAAYCYYAGIVGEEARRRFIDDVYLHTFDRAFYDESVRRLDWGGDNAGGVEDAIRSRPGFERMLDLYKYDNLDEESLFKILHKYGDVKREDIGEGPDEYAENMDSFYEDLTSLLDEIDEAVNEEMKEEQPEYDEETGLSHRFLNFIKGELRGLDIDSPSDLPAKYRKVWKGCVPDAPETEEIWSEEPVEMMYLGQNLNSHEKDMGIHLSYEAVEMFEEMGVLEDLDFGIDRRFPDSDKEEEFAEKYGSEGSKETIEKKQDHSKIDSLSDFRRKNDLEAGPDQLTERIHPKTNSAIVYHGTTEKKNIQNIATHGFDPGYGTMYGQGLYSVYDVRDDEQAATAKGVYGDYIARFKVDLTNDFVIFDYDEAKKIYGEDYKLKDQISSEKVPDTIKNRSFEEFCDWVDQINENDGWWTSDAAQDFTACVKNLENKFDGILFTGRKDGHVLVVYDTDLVKLIGWGELSGKSNSVELLRKLDGELATYEPASMGSSTEGPQRSENFEQKRQSAWEETKFLFKYDKKVAKLIEKKKNSAFKQYRGNVLEKISGPRDRLFTFEELDNDKLFLFPFEHFKLREMDNSEYGIDLASKFNKIKAQAFLLEGSPSSTEGFESPASFKSKLERVVVNFYAPGFSVNSERRTTEFHNPTLSAANHTLDEFLGDELRVSKKNDVGYHMNVSYENFFRGLQSHLRRSRRGKYEKSIGRLQKKNSRDITYYISPDDRRFENLIFPSMQQGSDLIYGDWHKQIGGIDLPSDIGVDKSPVTRIAPPIKERQNLVEYEEEVSELRSFKTAFTDLLSEKLPEDFRRYEDEALPLDYFRAVIDEIRRLANKIFSKKLGEGASRIVFQLDDKRVVKLATRPMGQNHNKMESDNLLQTSYPDLFPKVEELGFAGMWVVMEKVDIADFDEFLSFFPAFQEFLHETDLGWDAREFCNSMFGRDVDLGFDQPQRGGLTNFMVLMRTSGEKGYAKERREKILGDMKEKMDLWTPSLTEDAATKKDLLKLYKNASQKYWDVVEASMEFDFSLNEVRPSNTGVDEQGNLVIIDYGI